MTVNFKNLLKLTIIILFNNKFYYSQTVDSYYDSTCIWLLNSSCSAQFPCLLNSDYKYFFSKDTLINNNTYFKLYKKSYNHFVWMSATPTPISCNDNYIETTLIGFIRQHNKLVYLRVNNQDEILYNFDLNVGDTLENTYNNFQNDISVISIDSILINGQYVKRFNLSSNSTSSYMIEGIGHEFGFLEPFPPILECGYNLVCFKKNNITYFPDTNFNCSTNVDLSNNENIDVAFYPNPALNYLIVDLKKFKYSIVDVNYKILKSDEVLTENYHIDISFLKPGFFILCIDNKNHSFRTKFLKL